MSDRRKIVVATNVAETSITIDGIRHVIDSGLARVARFDSERGFGTLLIEEISRASADQRAGRAGRTAAGMCHRLWTESGHLNRPEHNTPEIHRTDLSESVLMLHAAGLADPATGATAVFVAPGNTGKTTLCRTLGPVRTYVSDETVGRDLERSFAGLDETALYAIVDVGKFDPAVADGTAAKIKKHIIILLNLIITIFNCIF